MDGTSGIASYSVLFLELLLKLLLILALKVCFSSSDSESMIIG